MDSSTLPRSAATIDGQPRRPALWPVRKSPYGPATSRRQWRTRIIYAAVCVVAVLPYVFSGPPSLRAFGLGLLFPGVGMFYPAGQTEFLANVVWFIGTIALLSIAFVLWFGSGNALAPTAVWLGSAAIAALRSPEAGNDWLIVVPIIGAVVFAVIYRIYVGIRFRAALKETARRNEVLSDAVVPALPRFIPDEPFVGPELEVDELELLRFGLEGALQPVDSFWGFDRRDQFQLTATRYQINLLAYTLANAHYSRMPAFHGYMAQAQRNLIEKTLVPEIWRYWRLENMWGNLRASADPVPRDNIMLTGYWGMQIGLYESITGDQRYTEPGSLTFDWNGSTKFPHDYHSVNKALHENYLRYDLGYFPCEPNWVYAACNAHGMMSLIVHDRLHGSDYAERHAESFRHAHEVEFVAPDGRPIEIKSTRIGWNFTFPAIFNGTLGGLSKHRRDNAPPAKVTGSGLVGAAPMLAGSILPDLTERDLFFNGYDETRSSILDRSTDLHAMSAAAGAPVYLGTLAQAVEYGDEELSTVIRDAYRTDPSNGLVRKNGVAYIEGLDFGIVGATWYGMFGRHGSSYDLINRGNLPEWDRGPILDEVPYPQVLVARAVTDGDRLSAVLRPGDAAGRFEVSVKRLAPGRTYAVRGGISDHVTASASGRCTFEIDLDGRLELELSPEGRGN